MGLGWMSSRSEGSLGRKRRRSTSTLRACLRQIWWAGRLCGVGSCCKGGSIVHFSGKRTGEGGDELIVVDLHALPPLDPHVRRQLFSGEDVSRNENATCRLTDSRDEMRSHVMYSAARARAIRKSWRSGTKRDSIRA